MDSNLFWCIVGIIGGAIFSFVISLIFHLIGKSRKHISYSVKTSCLISNDINKINNLEVKYNDKKIDNLYLSRINIKNTGNSIIEKDDFSTSNPLSINALKFTLSNSDFENKTYLNDNNNVDWSFRLSAPNEFSQLFIDFEYIPKHGIISFSVLHTDKVFIKGKLKDGTIYKKLILSKEEIYRHIIIGLLSGILSGIIFTIIYK